MEEDIAEIFDKHRKLQEAINGELDITRKALISPNPHHLVEMCEGDGPMLHVTAVNDYTRLVDYASGKIRYVCRKDNSARVRLKTISRSPVLDLREDGSSSRLAGVLQELSRDLSVWHLHAITRLLNFNATLSAQFLTDKFGETRYQQSRLDITAEFYAYNWVKS